MSIAVKKLYLFENEFLVTFYYYKNVCDDYIFVIFRYFKISNKINKYEVENCSTLWFIKLSEKSNELIKLSLFCNHINGRAWRGRY